jgi:hypothetical protein
MAEIVFERLAFAEEVTPFTLVTPPTHNLNIVGSITPVEEEYTPNDQYGTLEEAYRTQIMRRSAEWGGDGDVDIYVAPKVLGAVVKGGVTPTTPTNGVLTRLGTYVPTLTSNNLKTWSMYGGMDPALGVFQVPGGVVDSLEVTSDAGGTEAVKWSLSGGGAWTDDQVDATPPTFPAVAPGSLLIPGNTQLWIDTATIGTTAITGRLISTRVTIPTNYSKKFPAGQTPGTIPTITRYGRAKRRAEMELTFELTDLTQYNQWKNLTSLKVRLRHNGSLIESVTPDYYHYMQFDIYGPFRFGGWGEYEGTNRTITLTIRSIYDATNAASFAAYVQTIAAPFA